MKVGMTGTQRGMTLRQQSAFRDQLTLLGATELHHGDCIGADAEAHAVARDARVRIVVHPPENPSKRAFTTNESGLWGIRDEKPYLDRNRDIVDETDVLIATPKSSYEERRSGTWYTVRYAQKRGKRVILIMPDGSVWT